MSEAEQLNDPKELVITIPDEFFESWFQGNSHVRKVQEEFSLYFPDTNVIVQTEEDRKTVTFDLDGERAKGEERKSLMAIYNSI